MSSTTPPRAISPPADRAAYDVLDSAGKQRSFAKDPCNIVAIDLPHTPAKELGPSLHTRTPPSGFGRSAADGTLVQSPPH